MTSGVQANFTFFDIESLNLGEIVKNEFNYSISSNKMLAIAMVFTTHREKTQLEKAIRTLGTQYGIMYICRRDVPINPDGLSKTAKESCPVILQFFFVCPKTGKMKKL